MTNRISSLTWLGSCLLLVGTAHAVTSSYNVTNGGVAGAGETSYFSIQVTGAESILDLVQVRLAVTDPNLSELTISLIAPTGASSVLLFNQHNGSLLQDTLFTDSASLSISAGASPYVGSYKPEQPLSSLLGISGLTINGEWKLEILNNSTSNDAYLYGGVVPVPPWSNYVGTQLILTTHNDNPVPPTAGVPEPMTAGLSLLAIAGLGLAVSRRSSL